MKKRQSVSQTLRVSNVKGFNWEQFEAIMFNLLKEEFGDTEVRIEKTEKDSTTFVVEDRRYKATRGLRWITLETRQ